MKQKALHKACESERLAEKTFAIISVLGKCNVTLLSHKKLCTIRISVMGMAYNLEVYIGLELQYTAEGSGRNFLYPPTY
jgi:hypothetical protein